MAKWGKVDYRELKKLRDNLEKLQKVDMDALCTAMSKALASRLLRLVKEKTPIGKVPEWLDDDDDKDKKIKEKYWEGYEGSTLEKAWNVKPIVTKQGVVYEIEIYNPMEYASYVEYGHRQEVGRFVPQIGRKLKSSWVEGKFMLKEAEIELQSFSPRLLEKMLYEKLKEVFDVKCDNGWNFC